MKIMDRIAKRLGYVRPAPPEPRELIVFRRYQDARRAGFQGQRHPKYLHIMAWWPGLGQQGLAMRSFQRVTITDMMALEMTSEGPLFALLRHRMRPYGDDIMWVEL